MCVSHSSCVWILRNSQTVAQPGSHGILQAGILEWAAIPLSRVSSWSRGRTWISYIVGRLSNRLSPFPHCCPKLPFHSYPFQSEESSKPAWGCPAHTSCLENRGTGRHLHPTLTPRACSTQDTEMWDQAWLPGGTGARPFLGYRGSWWAGCEPAEEQEILLM